MIKEQWVFICIYRTGRQKLQESIKILQSTPAKKAMGKSLMSSEKKVITN